MASGMQTGSTRVCQTRRRGAPHRMGNRAAFEPPTRADARPKCRQIDLLLTRRHDLACAVSDEIAGRKKADPGGHKRHSRYRCVSRIVRRMQTFGATNGSNDGN
jgi:hypothetical protein